MPDTEKPDFEDSAGNEGVSHPPPHVGDDPFAEQHTLAQRAQRVKSKQHKAKLEQHGRDGTVPDL